MSMTDFEVKRILVCGATGQQGGAVVKALLDHPPWFPHEILALTRKASSPAARKLASNAKVKVIEGDLEHSPAIFEKAGGKGSVWGVFLVTLPSMKRSIPGVEDTEVTQGKALFDAALENGVSHFVFSSVDRGGDEKSWDTPTNVPHFITKHEIELHIREYVQAKVGGNDMTYTILRPTAFMDNYRPGLPGRIFAAAWAQLGQKRLQLVATSDIGIIAAQAFSDPEGDNYKNKAIGLAGDDISQAEANESMWRAKRRPMVQSYWIFAYLFKWMVADLGIMFKWFETDGYGCDIEKCRRLNPQMKDFKTWLKEESAIPGI
ncbi:hypothetical protein LTR70_009141 [Exophiala xenobiotica]|uniref:NmrA-like domain-containing protein n=1 Tax=Lithohypha guttulata TaxID=1690604 RepID=A0ABR0K2D3_9EURO|nr:hypothetical protein LTR24_008290 [Lithohypha guttulata]KAK5310923.1 hypothetical protein LTR70_009141 [Exophiala xenobiotica]